MANGIEDLLFDQFGNPLTFPDQRGPDIIGMGGAAISDLINNQLGFDLTTPQEGSRFIEEGVIGRDPEVVKNIIVDKVNNAPNAVKASIAGKVLGLADPAFAQIAAVNTANTALQKGGDAIQTGLQFGQEGVGALSDRIDDSRFDIFGIPSGALDLTGGALGLTDRGIERLQGEGQRFTGQVNVLGGVIYDQLGRPLGVVNRQIDRGVGALRNLFNLFRRDDDNDRRDDDPPVVVIDPNAVSQTFTTGGGSTPPPVVVTDTQKPYESGVGQQTGQTGGPAGMGFAPPPSNNPTGFGSNIRIGKAEGGLATIPRYLKGR